MANTVLLKVFSNNREERHAAGTISPGMFIERDSSGEFIAQSAALASDEIMIAVEDDLQGHGMSDDYSSGDRVFFVHLYPGDEVNALITTAENLAIGDDLEFTGDGKLREYTSGVKVAKAIQAIASAVAGTHYAVKINSLIGNLVANKFNTNATLRRDEWELLDPRLLKAFQNRLVGIADLYKAGMNRKINGLSRSLYTYEKQSDITAAEMGMDGVSRSKADRPVYTEASVPLPMIYKNFEFTQRVLNESRNRGEGLQSATAELAARKVADYAEALLFNGTGSITYAGGTIYGYLTAPNHSTYSIPIAWDDASATGELILTDVNNMMKELFADRRYGPFKVYIPSDYEMKMGEDYKANSSLTIEQRILQLSGIASVQVSDTLTDDNIVMAQMDSDTVELVEGLPITTMQENAEFNSIHRFKIATILVPIFKADANSRSGVCVGTV